MSSARSYALRARSNLPSPRAATPSATCASASFGIDLDRPLELGARLLVVAAVQVDDRLVQAGLHVLGVELGSLLKVQESLLVVTSFEGNETQVVPDESALGIEIRGLLQRGLGKFVLPHFIVGEGQSVIGNYRVGYVLTCGSQKQTGLLQRFVERARLAQHLAVAGAHVEVVRIGVRATSRRPTPAFLGRCARRRLSP